METLSKIVKKLPLYLQAKWAERSGSLIEDDIEPEFEHLTEFLEKNASVSNTMFGKLVGSKPDDDTKTKVKPRIPNNGTLFTTKAEGTKKDTLQDNVGTPGDDGSIPQKKEIKCMYCDQINHELGRCYKFRAKLYRERLDFVRKEKLCDNCLRKNHLARRCRFNAACMVSGCSGKHHSLLHPNISQKKPLPGLGDESKEESSQGENEAGKTGSCSTSINSRRKICLRIVPVKISNEEGTREIQTYAFIDNGSDTTLCTKDLVGKLNLSSEPCEFSLTTINGEKKTRSGQEVKTNVRNINGEGDIHLDRVWTVESLPILEKDIPTEEQINHWSHLSDIEFPRLENGKVSILIGGDVPEAHWLFEERRGKPKEPLAVRTLLGWTLLDPIGTTDRRETNVNFIHTDQEAITSQIQRLYNADFNVTSSVKEPIVSVEDQRAFEIMENSICKVDDHYQIALPWRHKSPCLSNNRSMAERRLRLLTNRLKKR